ncbi:hypothetical protein ACM64Y_14915 [Novispirillum sp. DQ9]|uniref:hypothetical protein n=1 Tax=Novispirillum sp. DQ9 TaxID=3398612 RepID=UPI003C79B29C
MTIECETPTNWQALPPDRQVAFFEAKTDNWRTLPDDEQDAYWDAKLAVTEAKEAERQRALAALSAPRRRPSCMMVSPEACDWPDCGCDDLVEG